MKIEHIALYVNDLEAAKDFFVRYFDAEPNAGYHNPRTDFRSYFLTFADGARLELMNKPGMSDEPKPAARTGYAHIAFSVGSREKVDALTARLKADGLEVLSGPRTTGDGYKGIASQPNPLNCEEEKVTMEASLTEDLEADSLDAVELNMALEDAFGVSIPDEELANMKTVGDIFNYLTAHAEA